MTDSRSLQHVALARELELSDLDVSARLDVVTSILQGVDHVRARAARVRAGLSTMPAEIEHAERDERDARARAADLQEELHAAERRHRAVDGSRRSSEDARLEAGRELRRAAVAAGDADASALRARERLEQLVREEATLQTEGEGLAVEAREVARAVAAVPRVSDSGRRAPGASLDEIEEWGARTHAALFVVRGSLESERERLVVEANGLAAAALGDHMGGSSVALVRRRLEEALGGG